MADFQHWFDASFSTGGFVGHLSYILLIVSMMMRNISLLRLLVIASALTSIAYDLIWLLNPVGVFWEALLLVVTSVQLWLLWRRDMSAKFSPEEEVFRSERLLRLSPGRTRDLLDLGRWEDLPAGTVLAVQDKPIDFLCYLAEGHASVLVGGRTVAQLGAGDYVGEMSLSGGGIASATVRLETPARVWRIEPDKVERLGDERPEIANAFHASLADDMRRKIMATNAAGAIPD